MSSKAERSEVVGVERLPRACGCVGDFVLFADDRYREQRREKFLRTRCSACGLKKNLEDNARQGGSKKIPKGQEIKRLPAGATITLQRRPDGSWCGQLTVGGITVDGDMGGAMGLVGKLARKYLHQLGAALQGKVS